MLYAPVHHVRKTRFLLLDLDGTAVDSLAPTRDPLLKGLHSRIRVRQPDMEDYEAFKQRTLTLSQSFNGNARGWQLTLGLPDEWTHDFYEEVSIPMAKAVCASCQPDPVLIDLLQQNQQDGWEQYLFTQATKTYCDIVVPHIGLADVFPSADRILHVNWAGRMLKTEEVVYKKIKQLKSYRHADIHDMVDDNPLCLQAGHSHGGCRTWLNGGEPMPDMQPYIFQHHPHIHQTLHALAA